MLRRAIRDAVSPLRLLDVNPCVEVSGPLVEAAEMTVLDAKQVDAMLKAAVSDRLHAMYVVAVATGMRQGELFALAWPDIDFDGGSVMVQRSLEEIDGKQRLKPPKTKKGKRRIELPKFAIDALHEHRKRMLAEGHAAGPVFCDRDGGYLRRQNMNRRSFKVLLKKAELPDIRFHDLRHTSASLLLLKGVNPKVVSERLGHASIEITLNTYSHVLPTMQREAADKLEKMFG